MKNIKALVLLFAANLVSGFAQGITMLSIPWYLVSDRGDDEGKLINAIMVATVTLLALFWGIYAGTLIDRYNRKRIFQALNGIDFLVLILAGFMALQYEIVPIWILAGVYCATIFTYNVHYPNLYAFVQELFEPRFYGKVNSAIELQGQFTNAVGMFLGGVLLVGSTAFPAWWPEAWAFDRWHIGEIFLLDGSTYLLSFFFISLIRYEPLIKRRTERGPILERIRSGFDYLWERKFLMTFGITSHLVFFSVIAIISVILPIYVNDYLGADAYVMARFKGMYAIGALSAGLIGLTIHAHADRTVGQVIGLLMLGSALFFICAFTQSILVTLIAAVLIGVCNAGIRILRVTYIIRKVPTRVVGRVNSFFTVVNVSMRSAFMGLMAIPFFSDEGNGSNIIYAFALLGLITLIGALTLLGFSRSRKRTLVRLRDRA